MTIQGAIAELQNLLDVDDVPFWYKGGIQKVIETIQLELLEIAGNDLVEVVRCNECKHYEADWCYWRDVEISANDYCSYGERRQP